MINIYFSWQAFVSFNKNSIPVTTIYFLWQQFNYFEKNLFDTISIYLRRNKSLEKSSICINKSFLVTRCDFLWQKITYIRVVCSWGTKKPGSHKTWAVTQLPNWASAWSDMIMTFIRTNFPPKKTWALLQFDIIRGRHKTQLYSNICFWSLKFNLLCG